MNLNPLRPVEPAVQAMRGADSRGAGGCYGMSNEELIAEARRRHIENPLEAAWCEGCDTSFPCDALILADALEVAERERDEFADVLEAAERERDEAVARGDRYHNLIRVWEGESSLSTCDWGGCSREAMGFRSCREHDEVHDQLPVCDQHTEAYEALQRERDEALERLEAVLCGE